MDRYQALKAIEARDPDGWDREPSEADYLAHEQWATDLYGREVWDQYMAGGWERTCEG